MTRTLNVTQNIKQMCYVLMLGSYDDVQSFDHNYKSSGF
jgi:hypothetical protein